MKKVTLKQTKDIIDSIEPVLLKSWEVFLNFKKNRINDSNIEDHIEFQFNLAEAIFKLEEYRENIYKVKKELIAIKKKCAETYFNKRIKELSKYIEFINQPISVAKSIGDGYVWIFYYNNQDLLLKHYRNPAVPHIRYNIGGKGELTFVKSLKVFQGNLIIYHGITNILRIGDISFFDLDKGKITSLGEIKTEKIEDKQIKLSLHLVTLKNDNSFNFKDININREMNKNPQWIKNRLNRQINKMTSAFDEISKVNIKEKLFIKGCINYHKLEKYYSNARIKKPSIGKFDDGLILMILKQRKSKLSTRIMKTPDITFLNKIDILNMFQDILLKDKENHILFNFIHYDIKSKIALIPGTIPLTWWPIDNDIIKEIIFFKIILCCIFNLGSIINKLKNKGYEFHHDKKNKHFYMKIKNQNGYLILENIGYYINLIRYYLVDETSIINMIDETIKIIKKQNIKTTTKVNLEYYQNLK